MTSNNQPIIPVTPILPPKVTNCCAKAHLLFLKKNNQSGDRTVAKEQANGFIKTNGCTDCQTNYDDIYPLGCKTYDGSQGGDKCTVASDCCTYYFPYYDEYPAGNDYKSTRCTSDQILGECIGLDGLPFATS